MPHVGAECEQVLTSYQADIGIILGARILPERTLRASACGIINVHPGILPENRGLDTVAWAVEKSWPQGVAAHVITPGRVDAGPLLGMYVLGDLEVDECLVEVSARLDSLQLGLLFQVTHSLVLAGHAPSGVTSTYPGPYHSYFSGSQAYLTARLEEYRQQYGAIVKDWTATEADLLLGLGDRFGWAETMDESIRSVADGKVSLSG
jgi:hypothetical protein